MAENLVPIAKILREHGVKGECKLAPFFGCEASIRRQLECTLESVRCGMRTAKILQVRESENFFIVRFDVFTSPESLVAWRGAIVKISQDKRQRLTPELLFDDEWVGMKIHEDSVETCLGVVNNVAYTPLRQLVVGRIDGADILIPVVEDWIRNVDLIARTVTLRLPEGLVDLS